MNKSWRTCSIVGLFITIFLCSFLTFGFFSFPSTRWITRNYFEGVIAGELFEATRYTSIGNAPDICIEANKELAQQDINIFGNSAVKEVRIEIFGTGGSDETIQTGRVYFEYRKANQAEWSTGNIQILTTYQEFGLRYACGEYP